VTPTMNSFELSRLFSQHAEEAQFREWFRSVRKVRFVYACEFGTVWKFTPKEWWQLVRKAANNQGAHEFFLSKAMRSRPRTITMGSDRRISSSDETIRCVNTVDWTMEDWNAELYGNVGESQLQ
jgi:hypothetical protein